MAALSTTAMTLADWAKSLDPNGKTAKTVELLSQSNEMLADMTFMEGNLPVGHQISQRTGLPSVYYRLVNAGVLPSKSTKAQIIEQCGMLEAYSQVDKRIGGPGGLNGNGKATRLSEAKAFIEAMNQRTQTTFIYGNSGTAPEEFTGFFPRMSAISGAGNASHVISGGGVGSDNMSILLVGWGENTVSGIFPKASKAGLAHEDLGEITIQNANGVTGAFMQAMLDHWMWDAGLAVMDWRYMVRICNIDTSNLVAQSSAADLPSLMIKALYRIPNLKNCKPVFYLNRTAMEMLDIERRADVITGGGLTFENVDGKRIPHFRQVPLRIVDALLETEASVS